MLVPGSAKQRQSPVPSHTVEVTDDDLTSGAGDVRPAQTQTFANPPAQHVQSHDTPVTARFLSLQVSRPQTPGANDEQYPGIMASPETATSLYDIPLPPCWPLHRPRRLAVHYSLPSWITMMLPGVKDQGGTCPIDNFRSKRRGKLFHWHLVTSWGTIVTRPFAQRTYIFFSKISLQVDKVRLSSHVSSPRNLQFPRR